MRYLFLLLWLLPVAGLRAQAGSSYLADLRALREILEKTPSYRDQIGGEKRVMYNKLYKKLESDSSSQPSGYRYFYNLAQLFFPIRDNHLGFYQVGQLPGGAVFPVFAGNTDSLALVLAGKPVDSVEGIYRYSDSFRVGLYKSADKEYTGVVLKPQVAAWKDGQVAIHLYETMPGYFKAIYAHPKYKTYMLYQVEKYTHQALVNSYFYSSFSEEIYRKGNSRPHFTDLPRGTAAFQFRTPTPGIQYLHIGHFSARPQSMQVSQVFYDSVRDKLTAPNLVVDLRNNEGGAAKVARKYVRLITKYAARNRVYILVNNGTMSQGEIVTLQLKRLPRVTVLGQTTRGTLTYGSNYGKRERLPGGAVEVYITDMKGKKRLVPYENYGIPPDIILNDETDWVEQTLQLIGSSGEPATP